MIHARQSARRGHSAQGLGKAWCLAAALVVGASLVGCGDDGVIDPETLRRGQVGRIEIHLAQPLLGSELGEGSLEQGLVWASSGAWTLTERVSYKDLVGDETFQRSPADRAQFAAAYAELITAVNEQEAQKLFIEALPDSLQAECGLTRTRITFTIRDDARDQEWTWVRCADGSLGTLTPTGAGPDAAASRLVLATLLARAATVGEKWTSAYLGTVPFGTLDRGENSSSRLTSPATFIDSRGFQSFWSEHAAARPLPAVDFAKDMVVVGIVGTRKEAGDSVEVRRILRVDQGTVIEVFERLPGAFCSPASRTHVPYHVVVAPRTPIPHRFADIRKDTVSCGG
jgi:hypothetical protein